MTEQASFTHRPATGGKPPTQEAELLRLCGIDASDVEANRRGQLTARQRRNLRWRGSQRALAMGVTFLVILAVVTALGSGGMSSAFAIVAAGIVLCDAMLVGLAWLPLANDVRYVRGTVQVQRPALGFRGDWATAELVVGDERCTLPTTWRTHLASWQRALGGTDAPYDVFICPQRGTVVAIVPADGRHAGPLPRRD